MSDVCETCGYDWVERDAWEYHLEEERRKAFGAGARIFSPYTIFDDSLDSAYRAYQDQESK